MSGDDRNASGGTACHDQQINGTGQVKPPAFDLDEIRQRQFAMDDGIAREDLARLIDEIDRLMTPDDTDYVMMGLPTPGLSDVDYLLIKARAEADGEQVRLTDTFRLLFEIDRLRAVLGISSGVRM